MKRISWRLNVFLEDLDRFGAYLAGEHGWLVLVASCTVKGPGTPRMEGKGKRL